MKSISVLLGVFFSLIVSSAFATDLKTLMANINSSNSDTRREAIYAIKSSGYRTRTDVIASLLNVLRTDSDNLNREYAAEALAENSTASARQSVIDTFMDPQYRSSHAAASWALRRVNSSGVKTAFLANTQHTDPDVRRNVASGLGQFVSDQAVVSKLVDMVNNDTNSLAREYAAESIAKLPADKAVPILADILKNPSSKGKAAACQGLHDKHSPLAIDPLISVLGDSDVDVRRDAIRGLTEFGARAKVFEALYQAFKKEQNSLAREYLFEGLMKSSDARALEVARANINSDSYVIRRDSMRKLKSSGDKTDLVALLGFLQSDDEGVRRDAYDAIKAILDRMSSNDPFKTRLVQCLPRVTYGNYSNSTKTAAFYMDVFLGGFGLFSYAANGQRRIIGRLSPEATRSLQSLVRVMLRDDDPYADLE